MIHRQIKSNITTFHWPITKKCKQPNNLIITKLNYKITIPISLQIINSNVFLSPNSNTISQLSPKFFCINKPKPYNFYKKTINFQNLKVSINQSPSAWPENLALGTNYHWLNFFDYAFNVSKTWQTSFWFEFIST